MKVKNIMFSGVMGIILMSVASSANAAIQVASKAYVDQQKNAVAGLVSAETEAREAADTALETAYKAADSALETAYKAADSALDTRVAKNTTDIATNAQEIAAVKGLTGTEGVATQISKALEVETQAREAAVSALQTKDTELAGDIAAMDTAYKAADSALDGKITAMDTAYKAADTALDGKITAMDTAYKAADTALAGDIAGVDAKFADYTKTADLDASFATNDELAGAVSDLEAADTALDGKISAMDTAYKAADTTLDGKITAMDTAYKAADTGLQNAIDTINDSDVMNSGIDATKVGVLDGFIENNCSAESELCVLSKNQAGNYAWTDVTAPLDEPQQN